MGATAEPLHMPASEPTYARQHTTEYQGAGQLASDHGRRRDVVASINPAPDPSPPAAPRPPRSTPRSRPPPPAPIASAFGCTPRRWRPAPPGAGPRETPTPRRTPPPGT